MEPTLPVSPIWFDVALLVVGLASSMLHRRAKALGSIALMAFYAFICWGILFAEMRWYDDAMMAWIGSIQNPSDEQLRLFSADGGPKAFLLLFGYPVCFIYLALCWGFVKMARLLTRKFLSRATQPAL
jgi:hypothetical protein